ncbi:uncharacterized protein LOC125520095 [Triticum urartu]|uniref:uncharacterized protein LOC125520095 n=1 Tax=Triticum urartu TaxID=4572 RepID=UPI0020436054|nr:uncharacterized protein LOC125520095 [Triticum urartu]
MSQSSPPPGKKEPKKDRAAWTNSCLAFLVSMMKEYSDVGKYHGQNGWTKEGWQAMKDRLNARPPGANFTVQQLKDREQRLKKELNVVKSIVEKSGFGWDPKNKVPTALDEKWEELSSEQRKWRHKPFPYYDVLYEIHEGKMAEGKHCKRTTDGTEERYKNMSQLPEHGTYTDDVMRAASMDTPEATLSAPGSAIPEYDWGGNIYGDDVDLSYGGYSEPLGSNENHVSAVEDLTSVDSPRRKRLQNSKGSDDRSDKTKGKRGKDIVLSNLVSVREEEMQTYKEMKTKQIDSYKEIKMAQMERNDPKNDPYGMPNCIQKLKTLGLTPSDQHKMINHLKKIC